VFDGVLVIVLGMVAAFAHRGPAPLEASVPS
jgi:hypothetical protein